MSHRHPEWFATLPGNFNNRQSSVQAGEVKYHQLLSRVGKRHAHPPACIEHFSANGAWAEGQHARPRSIFYHYLRHWRFYSTWIVFHWPVGNAPGQEDGSMAPFFKT